MTLRENPEFERNIEDANLDIEEIAMDNDELWKDLKRCLGMESGGWMIDDKKEAISTMEFFMEETLASESEKETGKPAPH